MKSLTKLFLIVAVGLMMSAAAWADAKVYVRMNDGRIIYVPHERVQTYVTEGGVVVDTLPVEYVNEAYTYSSGYPVYYTGTYWHRHHRHFKHEDEWRQDADGNWHHHEVIRHD